MDNLEFDRDGFLTDPACWDEGLAERLAQEDGLGELKDEQWAILRALRKHYLKSGGVPALPHICQTNQFDRWCMNEYFPDAKEAWRLAGLPNPGEEAKAYM